MSECVSEGQCVVELSGKEKLEAFDLAINACDRFEIAGLDESETKFVLRDATLKDGIEGRYVEIDVAEVIEKPLKDILDVIVHGRNDKPVKGYTRIVGYYSGIENWNASKIGELRDRANGIYGNPHFVDKNNGERMSYIDSH